MYSWVVFVCGSPFLWLSLSFYCPRLQTTHSCRNVTITMATVPTTPSLKFLCQCSQYITMPGLSRTRQVWSERAQYFILIQATWGDSLKGQWIFSGIFATRIVWWQIKRLSLMLTVNHKWQNNSYFRLDFLLLFALVCHQNVFKKQSFYFRDILISTGKKKPKSFIVTWIYLLRWIMMDHFILSLTFLALTHILSDAEYKCVIRWIISVF